MRKHFRHCVCAVACLLGLGSLHPVAALNANEFVSTDGTDLILNGHKWRFSGGNTYAMLAYKKEADNIFRQMEQMGLNVLRIWGFWNGESDYDQYGNNITGRGTDEYGRAILQATPGVHVEVGWDKFDYVVARAGSRKIKLIVALGNWWDEFGGTKWYMYHAGLDTNGMGDNRLNRAGTYGKEQFYKDAECKRMYKEYISYVLNRMNTYTGIAYKDDPAIMIWEPMNEPRYGIWESDSVKALENSRITTNWIDTMATYIKSIDSMHLVGSGEEGFYIRDNEEIHKYYIESPYHIYPWALGESMSFINNSMLNSIDVISVHGWPFNWKVAGGNYSKYYGLASFLPQWVQVHYEQAQKIGKPLYLAEFGFQIMRNHPESNLAQRDSVYDSTYAYLRTIDIAGVAFWNMVAEHNPDSVAYNDTEIVYPGYPGQDDSLFVFEGLRDTVIVPDQERFLVERADGKISLKSPTLDYDLLVDSNRTEIRVDIRKAYWFDVLYPEDENTCRIITDFTREFLSSNSQWPTDTVSPIITPVYPAGPVRTVDNATRLLVKTNEATTMRWGYENGEYGDLPYGFLLGQGDYLHEAFLRNLEDGRGYTLCLCAQDMSEERNTSCCSVSFTTGNATVSDHVLVIEVNRLNGQMLVSEGEEIYPNQVGFLTSDFIFSEVGEADTLFADIRPQTDGEKIGVGRVAASMFVKCGVDFIWSSPEALPPFEFDEWKTLAMPLADFEPDSGMVHDLTQVREFGIKLSTVVNLTYSGTVLVDNFRIRSGDDILFLEDFEHGIGRWGATDVGDSSFFRLDTMYVAELSSVVPILESGMRANNGSLAPVFAVRGNRIVFSVPANTVYRLRMYNSRGREIAILHQGVSPPGFSKRLAVVPVGMAQGSYLISLENSGRRMLKRFQVVR